MFDVVVLWLQRDLRLHDNPALTAALLTAKRVIIAYVWAKEEEGQFQPGKASRWWLHHGLRVLEEQVRAKGSYVCFRRGPCAVDQLLHICSESGARVVFFNNVYDPLSLVRDHDVKCRLAAAGVVARSFNAELLYEPWEVLDEGGKPFTTFESFWHKITTGMAVPPSEPNFAEPDALPTLHLDSLKSVALDDLELETADEAASNQHLSHEWTAGTTAGLQMLVRFLEHGLPLFDHDRAKIDRESTSKLSPYIHFGEISIRVIYAEAKRREAAIKAQNPGSTAVDDFVRQLGYREYSRYLSFHFPFTHERSLLEHLRATPWVHCPMRFKAWRQGATGFPIVDASMRQLWATGWMHNRARVFTASFLVKNLLLPWQWGLKHFWDTLLDADLECDALGWQYVAGCLVDSKPFVHMMSVEAESARFDADGAFVRQWVPELAHVPRQYLHEPWRAPPAVLEAAGVCLGVDYPTPIVTLDESEAALAHAWGVVLRCSGQDATAAAAGPYRAPSKAVDLKELDPEEEVEQGAAGAASGPASTGSLSASTRYGADAGTSLGVAARPAAYPPMCVLPDISHLLDHDASAARMRAACQSCGSTGGLHEARAAAAQPALQQWRPHSRAQPAASQTGGSSRSVATPMQHVPTGAADAMRSKAARVAAEMSMRSDRVRSDIASETLDGDHGGSIGDGSKGCSLGVDALQQGVVVSEISASGTLQQRWADLHMSGETGASQGAAPSAPGSRAGLKRPLQ